MKPNGHNFFLVCVAGFIVFMVLLVGSMMYCFPPDCSDLTRYILRFKNTFSFYMLGKQPTFYGLSIEKNGGIYRLTSKDMFNITYRDEFIITDVSTDVIWGRGITVEINGFNKQQAFGVMFKGIHFVDQGMKSVSHVNGPFRINIKYRDEIIGFVPINIAILPQDWLRQARKSENENEQIEYIGRAVVMNKEDIAVKKMLADILNRTGRTEAAVKLYQEIILSNPKDSYALTELTKDYISRKKYAEAIDTCTRIIQINPKDASAYANMALAYGHLGNWDKAVESYQESLKINSENPWVRYKFAEAYERTQKIDLAIEQYKRVLEKQHNAETVVSALANAYLRLRQYDQAIKWYRALLKIKPGTSSAYANIGIAYGGMGLLNEEIFNYKKAVMLSPNDPVIHFNLGMAYEKARNYQEAAKEYQKVLAIRQNDINATLRLANIYFNQKKYSQSIELYERVINHLPNKALVYLNLGFAYGGIKKHELSVENFIKALQSGIKDPQIHYYVAVGYRKAGKIKDSIAHYEKYVLVHPTLEVYDIISNYYMKEGQYDRAITNYKMMTELNPQKASIYSSIGYAYSLSGDLARSIEYYNISLKYDHEDAFVYFNLGQVYEKQGKYQEAIKAYKAAYELNPDLAEAAKKIPYLKIKMLEKKYGENDKNS